MNGFMESLRTILEAIALPIILVFWVIVLIGLLLFALGFAIVMSPFVLVAFVVMWLTGVFEDKR